MIVKFVLECLRQRLVSHWEMTTGRSDPPGSGIETNICRLYLAKTCDDAAVQRLLDGAKRYRKAGLQHPCFVAGPPAYISFSY